MVTQARLAASLRLATSGETIAPGTCAAAGTLSSGSKCKTLPSNAATIQSSVTVPMAFLSPGNLRAADASFPAFELNQAKVENIRVAFGDAEHDRVDYSRAGRSRIAFKESHAPFALFAVLSQGFLAGSFRCPGLLEGFQVFLLHRRFKGAEFTGSRGLLRCGQVFRHRESISRLYGGSNVIVIVPFRFFLIVIL